MKKAKRYEESKDRHDLDENEPDATSIQHALSLVKRAVIVWIVLLSLLIVTGWLV